MGPDLGKAADAGDFEWVNAWASNAQAVPAAEPGMADAVQSTRAPPHLVVIDSTSQSPDQLMRDIVDIEHARDALQAERLFMQAQPRRTQALMLIPTRTADTVPIFVGGVLALMMLTVFGAAAMVSKLAR